MNNIEIRVNELLDADAKRDALDMKIAQDIFDLAEEDLMVVIKYKIAKGQDMQSFSAGVREKSCSLYSILNSDHTNIVIGIDGKEKAKLSYSMSERQRSIFNDLLKRRIESEGLFVWKPRLETSDRWFVSLKERDKHGVEVKGLKPPIRYMVDDLLVVFLVLVFLLILIKLAGTN